MPLPSPGAATDESATTFFSFVIQYHDALALGRVKAMGGFVSKFVCSECVAERYLQGCWDFDEIEECSYCQEERGAVELEELVEACRESVRSSFELVEQPPSVYIHNRNPIGEHWTDVLHRMLGCSDELVGDIGEALWADSDDDDPYFKEGVSANADMTYEWKEMERSLRDEARFVNPTVTRVLEQVFGAVDQLHLRDSKSAIFAIGPGQPLHTFIRARVFSSDVSVEEALLHPERSLGPPPPGLGAAGRMNAKGVSVFYGATNDRTAIAEVRPPVGSYVVTAAFQVTRPLRLLNLAALNEIRPDHSLSYFDPRRVEQAKRCAFLASLQKQLLKPVMPELVDQGYLITQAIADFLSMHPTLNLDGIYFPSIQLGKRDDEAPGHNVILFNKASGVHRTEPQFKAEYASLWVPADDTEYYHPQIFAGLKQEEKPSWWMEQPVAARYEPALELDREAIRVHQVKWVDFGTDDEWVEYHP